MRNLMLSLNPLKKSPKKVRGRKRLHTVKKAKNSIFHFFIVNFFSWVFCNFCNFDTHTAFLKENFFDHISTFSKLWRQMRTKQLKKGIFCICSHLNTVQTWKLKFSDPAREGRFLNVPIQYGEWVPINRARVSSQLHQKDLYLHTFETISFHFKKFY